MVEAVALGVGPQPRVTLRVQRLWPQRIRRCVPPSQHDPSPFCLRMNAVPTNVYEREEKRTRKIYQVYIFVAGGGTSIVQDDRFVDGIRSEMTCEEKAMDHDR